MFHISPRSWRVLLAGIVLCLTLLLPHVGSPSQTVHADSTPTATPIGWGGNPTATPTPVGWGGQGDDDDG